MNILFICKFNRFRSKVAEAFFIKLNKNPKHKAKSAGIIRGSKISKEIKAAAKDFGIKINSQPQGLSTKLLKWQELAIIVANDVPKEILADNKKYKKKLEVWKIPDTDNNNQEGMDKIISEIEKRVKHLVEELK
jgi:arsenate reductase (thioredoxin)